MTRQQTPLLLLFLLLVTYLIFVGARMGITYFDSYEIMNNARLIAEGRDDSYALMRAPFLPSLLSIFFTIEQELGVEGFGMKASQVFSVLLYAALVVAAYNLFRKPLDQPYALVGAGLLALNPILIHVAPKSKEDILAALFVTLSMHQYLKASESRGWRSYLMLGALLGGALSSRYNVAPVVLLPMLLVEILSRRIFDTPILARKIVCVGIVPIVLFFAIPMLVFPIMGRCSVLQAPAQLFDDILRQYAVMRNGYEFQDPIQYLRFVLKSITPPVFLLSFVGMMLFIRERALWVSWIVVFFIVHCWLVTYKEARYLFPVLPALYLFAARGVKEVFERFRPSERLRFPIFAAVFIWPLIVATLACLRFTDPVYRVPFEKETSLTVFKEAGAHQAYWLGPFYPLHPKDYFFDIDDEFTAIYHFAPVVIGFYGHRPAPLASYTRFPFMRTATEAVLPHPALCKGFRDKDVVIVNTEIGAYDTRSLPKDLGALVLQRVRAQEHLFAEGKVTITGRGNEALLRGRGLIDGDYLLYLKARSSGSLTAVNAVHVREGALSYALKGTPAQTIEEASGVTLMSFEHIKSFKVPD